MISKRYKYIPRRLKKMFNISKRTQVWVYKDKVSILGIQKEIHRKNGYHIIIFQYYNDKCGLTVDILEKSIHGVVRKQHCCGKVPKKILVSPTIIYFSERFYRYHQKGLPYKRKSKINEKGINDPQLYIKEQWDSFIETIKSSPLLLKTYRWKMFGLYGTIKNEDLKKELKRLRGNLFYYLLII